MNKKLMMTLLGIGLIVVGLFCINFPFAGPTEILSMDFLLQVVGVVVIANAYPALNYKKDKFND